MMKQQIAALQKQLHNATTTPMQSADDTATTSPLHSMGTIPHYDWSLSDGLTELMNLVDTPLHTTPPISDSERKTIVEAYPPMGHLDYYMAPATIPTAERLMNKRERYENHSLKHLQYLLLSAVYLPLNILAYELVSSSEVGNPNLERYCTMLQDVRKLLLPVGSFMNQAPWNRG
ncbi:hypothetical protein PS6_011221 [Mucor atramentarius]